MRWPTLMLVVAADAEGAEERVHQDQHDTGGEQQLARWHAGHPRDADGMASEHVVDDDLQWPGLGQLEDADEQDLEDGARERQPVGP